MADIRFYCPACRGKLVVDAAASGHHANCPHCKKRLLIPRESEQPPKPAAPAPLPRFPSGDTLAGVLTTTQKIVEDRTSLPSPFGGRVSAPVAAPVVPVAAKSAPAALPKKPVPEPPRVLGGDALTDDAKQRLTDLIQGLQRENADLRRQLAAAQAVPADTGERTRLQQDLAAREGRITALEKELVSRRSEHDSAQAALLRATAICDEQSARADEQTVRLAECEARCLLLDEACVAERREAARQRAAATTLQLELRALRSVLDRTSSELSAAVLDRDRMLTDAVHARNRAGELARGLAAEQATAAAAKAELLATAGRESSAAKVADERAAGLTEEIERLTSERSALLVTNDEVRDQLAATRSELERAQQDTERVAKLQVELETLRAKAAENEPLRDRLSAFEKDVEARSAEVTALRERSAKLEEDNQRLLQQVGAKERELRSRVDAAPPPIQNAKTMRRVEELEASMRTADAFARGLKSRIAMLETENARLQAAAIPAPASTPPPMSSTRTDNVTPSPPMPSPVAPPPPSDFQPARREGRGLIGWVVIVLALAAIVAALWYFSRTGAR